MTNANVTLQKIAERANDLYSLPAVAMEVLELTNNPQVDAAALKRCIEADPALTVKLLRVVNSSLYGLSREVSDLNQTLALLGTKPLKLLVLGFSLPPGMFAGLTGDVLKRYWRHTLIKAVAARELAEKQSPESGDEAFIAGLLQDIGILLLVQELGAPYVSFVDKVLGGGGNLIDLETRSLGFDHTMLTSRLLAQWRLPKSLVEAVLSKGPDQFPPADNSSSPDMARLLQLADLVSRFLADGNPRLLFDLLAAGEEYCCLNPRQLEEMLAGLKEKVVQLADVLSIDVAEDADYGGLLAEAHRQLVEVAAEVAGDMVRQSCFGSTPESETEALLADLAVLSELITQVPDDSNRSPAREDVSPPALESTPTAGSQPCPEVKLKARPVVAETAIAPSLRTATSAAISADPGTLGQLAAAVAACRRNRCPLSLMLAELDDVDGLAFAYGVDGLGNLRGLLQTACSGLDHDCAICLPHGEAGFAVVLANCDRSSGIELGHQLLEQVKHLSANVAAPTLTPIGVSIGVATLSLPSKNFPPEDLFESAARCLYGSHASGGGVVKSIEIY
jgi:HD-like signal output (HDOD) protein/GGDEF domain-containing protein